MKALLLVAHGSRRNESNEEVRRLASRIQENAGPACDMVLAAFLEISTPQIDSAVAELARNGATEIMVFPYFLSAGTHVATDIPRLVAAAREAHPDILFEILPHMGALPGIGALILGQLLEPGTGLRPATEIGPHSV